MKKILKSLMFLVMGAFALASCEDVPAPYVVPGGDTPSSTLYTSASLNDWTSLAAEGLNNPWIPGSNYTQATGYQKWDGASSKSNKQCNGYLISPFIKTVTEENKITYTDFVGLLMSSVTTIINVISYVLIAFVAVSLIVSSIMIGIITYISVLERTKEIGILRAIGASKRNISQVFNAETFIIGLLSGLIGIGTSLLLLIPINAIIHHIVGNNTVNAVLPLDGAVILIILSVILTLIGGLIPSKKAAKKDPVAALRTE